MMQDNARSDGNVQGVGPELHGNSDLSIAKLDE
jgi:hypothetical protein